MVGRKVASLLQNSVKHKMRQPVEMAKSLSYGAWLDWKPLPPYAGQDNLHEFRRTTLSPKRLEVSDARARAGSLLGVLLILGTAAMHAQTCTTQARMSDTVRNDLSGAAMHLAQAIKDDSTASVQAATIAEFASASSFAPTASVVQTTAPKLGGDVLRVTQVYQLDARGRKAGDTSEADFSCALTGTTAETDFSISGLPPGLYGFAMVDATGDRPWLLSFLLRQDSGVWKLAGFYPRARTAAGHDGLWYWTSARAEVKSKELWLAWLLYGEADALLRPANFATSTNLDRLRAEQTAAAPPELINGIGPELPLVIKATNSKGAAVDYSFTSIAAEGSEDGRQLKLVLHLSADYLADPVAGKARNRAAASALLDAHKDLRQDFNSVWVFADSAGHEPLLTDQPISEIP